MHKRGIIYCKRGSHVGMMISFALFITLLAFLYSVLEPALKSEKEQEFILNYLEKELIEEFSEELIVMSVIIDESIPVGNDCVKIESINNKIIEAGGLIDPLIIKDENGVILEYKEVVEGLEIDNSNGLRFFKIYYSEKIINSNSDDVGSCDTISVDEYKLGLTKKEEYISEMKINTIKDDIQEEIELPIGVNFGFNFIRNDGTSIGTEDGEITKSVFVREVPVQYFNENASVFQGTLDIKIW